MTEPAVTDSYPSAWKPHQAPEPDLRSTHGNGVAVAAMSDYEFQSLRQAHSRGR